MDLPGFGSPSGRHEIADSEPDACVGTASCLRAPAEGGLNSAVSVDSVDSRLQEELSNFRISYSSSDWSIPMGKAASYNRG